MEDLSPSSVAKGAVVVNEQRLPQKRRCVLGKDADSWRTGTRSDGKSDRPEPRARAPARKAGSAAGSPGSPPHRSRLLLLRCPRTLCPFCPSRRSAQRPAPFRRGHGPAPVTRSAPPGCASRGAGSVCSAARPRPRAQGPAPPAPQGQARRRGLWAVGCGVRTFPTLRGIVPPPPRPRLF